MRNYLWLELPIVAVYMMILAAVNSAYANDPIQKVSSDPSRYIHSLLKRDPLLTIKFHEAEPYMYQSHIRDRVRQVLSRFPGAFFDVLAVIPETGHFISMHDATVNTAENIKDVVEMFDLLRLPRSKYQVSYITSSDINKSEIRLFWRQRL